MSWRTDIGAVCKYCHQTAEAQSQPGHFEIRCTNQKCQGRLGANGSSWDEAETAFGQLNVFHHPVERPLDVQT